MAEPKAEKIERKLEETGGPNQGSELSDADMEKVAGSAANPGAIDTFKKD